MIASATDIPLFGGPWTMRRCVRRAARIPSQLPVLSLVEDVQHSINCLERQSLGRTKGVEIVKVLEVHGELLRIGTCRVEGKTGPVDSPVRMTVNDLED